MSAGQLAERLSLEHHSAVGRVDRLSARDLIQRRHDKADRRRVVIALTAQAETLLLKLTLAHRDELRRLAPLLRSLLQSVEAAES
jgi:DNA-binding MarR family transcriptional regulator